MKVDIIISAFDNVVKQIVGLCLRVCAVLVSREKTVWVFAVLGAYKRSTAFKSSNACYCNNGNSAADVVVKGFEQFYCCSNTGVLTTVNTSSNNNVRTRLFVLLYEPMEIKSLHCLCCKILNIR